ncbi:hypothetical protein H2204_005270 [Knufia peltigerae]|uniref:RGS domain-containing protein n=1 Tax=Knufia peltigerae TaxID=1002370 RepID=A0AA38Y5L6_9EURO|nr:hypothetical protein H2204_005270 [Knufia peltigerae]
MVSENNEFGISHETELKARLGPVGFWWIGFVIGWTLFLFSGMGFLFYKRHAPSAKVRGIWVPFTAVIALHLYWCSVNLGYIYGPIFPGEAEFWIMGIYLPLGYALFHASNSRFLQVAQVQEQYATSFGLAEAMDRQRMTSAPVRRHKGPRWLACRLRSADPARKLAFWITCGMVVQLTLTVTMFLISRKYHPSFGIPGTETHGTEKEQLMQKGRGWEWWPSIAWQIVWSWGYSLYNLWRSRHIKDTHGWRLQTIGCCLAGLPASPMWLIALYVPAMAPINNYWIPPQWIAVCIMMIEIFTIFVPCSQVIRQPTIDDELLKSIEHWDLMRKFSHASVTNSRSAAFTESSDSAFEKASGKQASSSTSCAVRDPKTSNMAALEETLKSNPGSLQAFAALRDFSGENVAFLVSVMKWKSAWTLATPQKAPQSPVRESEAERREAERRLVRQQFNHALSMYVLFISWEHAPTPLNLASREYHNLKQIFQHAVQLLYADVETSESQLAPSGHSVLPFASDVSGTSFGGESDTTNISSRVWYWGPIPEAFQHDIFDAVECSTKYLLYTNTWSRYNGSIRSNDQSADNGHQIQSFWRLQRAFLNKIRFKIGRP